MFNEAVVCIIAVCFIVLAVWSLLILLESLANEPDHLLESFERNLEFARQRAKNNTEVLHVRFDQIDAASAVELTAMSPAAHIVAHPNMEAVKRSNKVRIIIDI